MTIQEAIKARTAPFKQRYANFIGGRWVDPVDGRWFDNRSPIDGQVICQVARSQAADIELALDAAQSQGGMGPHQRRRTRADPPPHRRRMEETCPLAPRDLGTMEADPRDDRRDLPLAIDHFRYFAGQSAPRKAAFRRSTTTRSPITFTNRSAWWGRSSRGTSRC